MNRWTAYSLLLIVSTLLILFLKFKLFPNFLDIYYHLGVASGFNKAGGYVTNAFWEFAPQGRVNLYPPFFHFLLLGLIKLGLPLVVIARLMDVIIFPSFLLAIWFVSRSLFNVRVAFFLAALACLNYSFYLCSSNFIPVTLSFILGLFSFWAVERGKYGLAIITLAVSFYTHAQIPWLFLFTFLIYAFLTKKLFIWLRVIVISLCLASPFLFHLLRNIPYYKFFAYENFVLEFNLCLIFSIVGIRKAIKEKGVYLFPLILMLVSLLFTFSYPYRYTSGQGLLGLMVLSAIGIEEMFSKRNTSKSLIIFFLIICGSSLIITREKEIKFLPFNSTFVNLMGYNQNIERGNGYSLYSKRIQALVKVIRQQSDDDDIIYTNLPLAGTIISAMSQRADAQGILREIKPRMEEDPIRNSKLIVWFKQEETQGELSQILKQYPLSKIDETDMAYIYKNDALTPKVHISKPLVPHKWVAIIFICLLILCVSELWFKNEN